MSSSADKAAHELTVFLEFAKAAHLDLDSDSCQTCAPPEPDIRCMVAGEVVYFELGRLLDPELQKARVWLLKHPSQQVSAADYRVRLPERDVLRRKLASTYSTDGAPLELLLYFDAENPLVAGGLPPGNFDLHAQHVMVPELARMRTPMRRVWVFERYQSTVLWSYPR